MDTIILNQHLDPPTQAQQLDELSLVKGSRVSWWANESSCDWKVFEYLQNHHLSCCPNLSFWLRNHFFLSLSQCIARSGDDPWEIRGRLVAWPVWQQGFFLFFIGQYGNKVPATKPILAYSLNLRSAGFHRITHKRKSTTRTPTAWQRTSSTSWWNSNFPSNFLLGLSFPSLFQFFFAGGALCIQGPGRHWIELQQRRPPWGNFKTIYTLSWITIGIFANIFRFSTDLHLTPNGSRQETRWARWRSEHCHH